MENFKYADEQISPFEILFAVPSIVIAVGILILPRSLASVTVSSDGWVALLIGGLLAIFVTWVTAKVAAAFPSQNFITYATTLVKRPIAVILTFLFAIQGIILTAYEIKQVSYTSQQYLFDRTPMEIISLSFLLLVVYAVAGTRAGVFRLNVMFLPIIIFATIILIVFSLVFVRVENVLPVFQTDIKGYFWGVRESTMAYTGYGILFFYIAFVKNSKQAPKMAAAGMSIAVVLYILIFLTCIAVFGNVTTANLMSPTVELAKTIEIPGGILERFESIFFMIWIMAIFNTAVIALDIAVLAITSIFPSINKVKLLLFLCPVTYFISELPNNITELEVMGEIMGTYSVALSLSVLVLLLIMMKVRGVKNSGSQ
ncbi:endospore germination permease [Virgibacillus halodenitrificans]|uniref:GerAB/ArcD/ProY family transporter n=1 Tax=Virgibacillus halodenitrificans TaxID=1482 RepID=UPI001F1BA55F|nr:endospore germination permease [Virgibacillus halodenitrificans]MCG1027961.1 endospore germination permease [Virgibacillus halodenitrificans]